MKKIVIIKDRNNCRFYGELKENQTPIEAGYEILLKCRIRNTPCAHPAKVVGVFEKLPAEEIQILLAEMENPVAPWRMEEIQLATKYC